MQDVKYLKRDSTVIKKPPLLSTINELAEIHAQKRRLKMSETAIHTPQVEKRGAAAKVKIEPAANKDKNYVVKRRASQEKLKREAGQIPNYRASSQV